MPIFLIYKTTDNQHESRCVTFDSYIHIDDFLKDNTLDQIILTGYELLAVKTNFKNIPMLENCKEACYFGDMAKYLLYQLFTYVFKQESWR